MNRDYKEIRMPDGCRYMSDWKELQDELPDKGWFILDKTLCGCGGTTVFLESDKDLILVSPRTNMLVSKHKQYEGRSHLFRESKKDKLEKLMENLGNYVNYGSGGDNPILGRRTPRKILVTVDSYKHVARYLMRIDKLDRYQVVIDEMQCLLSDASFKGQTEMEFLTLLGRTAKNVCFMSATPIDINFLDSITYFEGVPYYRLKWDPNVMETPNLKDVKMKYKQTPRTICREIIDNFRRDGYFARKIWNDRMVYSREICIYINEVRTIVSIIKDNQLQPEEVTILCSDSTTQKKEIERLGFKVGGLGTDRNHPRNKTFTFCTRASFEGVDMYSDNAFTVIFANAHKEWETYDISIDLPQIMARQRLAGINPFCRDALLYYETDGHPQSREDVVKKVDEMVETTNEIICSFNSSSEQMKQAYVYNQRNLKESAKYQRDFIDVVDLGENGYELRLNQMVMLARLNLWRMQSLFYSNPIKLVKGMYGYMGENYNAKPDDQYFFERSFYKSDSWSERMQKYTAFRVEHPEYRESLLSNPFFPPEFHDFYELIGPERLAELGFRKKLVIEEYEDMSKIPQIQELCQQSFERRFYSNAEVKDVLSGIFVELGVHRSASAVDIEAFLDVEPKNIVAEDGKRVKGYLIL